MPSLLSAFLLIAAYKSGGYITLLFTRCATSNASRHFKSPLAMGRDAFKSKHASSVSISGVIDTGVNSNCQPSEKDLLPADQPLAKGLYKMLLFILSQGSYQHLPVLHSIQILQRQLQVLPVLDKTVRYGYCCHVDLFHKGMLLPLLS